MMKFFKRKLIIVAVITTAIIISLGIYIKSGFINGEGSDFANCKYVNSDSSITYIDSTNQTLDSAKTSLISACFYGNDAIAFCFGECGFSDELTIQRYKMLVNDIKSSHPGNLQWCSVVVDTCYGRTTFLEIMEVTKDIFHIDTIRINNIVKSRFEFEIKIPLEIQ